MNVLIKVGPIDVQVLNAELTAALGPFFVQGKWRWYTNGGASEVAVSFDDAVSAVDVQAALDAHAPTYNLNDKAVALQTLSDIDQKSIRAIRDFVLAGDKSRIQGLENDAATERLKI
jgi:hypothetical protein